MKEQLDEAQRGRETAEAQLAESAEAAARIEEAAARAAELAAEQLSEWRADEPREALARRGVTELRRRERQMRAATDRVGAAIEHAVAERESEAAHAAAEREREANNRRAAIVAAEEQRVCIVCLEQPGFHVTQP